MYSQGLPQINHFTGSPNEERTFADWFDMMRRSIPDFYELDEYQRWNHVASRLKSAALDYWLGIEKFTRCTFDEAIEAMIQMYKDRSDPATRLQKLTTMTMKPGQDLKEFLITQIAYMRRKTPAYQMDAACGTRICANIMFNTLPSHLKAPLIRFRSEGTTEELAAAAIELEEAMQGAKEEKQKAKNRAGRGFFNKGGKDGGESPNQNRRPFNNFNRGFQRGSPVNRTDVKSMRSINVAELEIGEVKAESDAAVQKAMDGHLKIMVRAGVRYVQLGNKIFASGQFRTLCYLYERCFACGKKHRIADCPTKDDPLFPNLVKDGLPRQGPNNTGQPVRPWVRLTGNRNNRPEETAQINMQEEDEEELLPDGDYMYQSPTCDVVGNGSSGIPSDAGDAPEILSALPQTEDDFYFRSAEAYDLEVAAIEVIPLTLPQDGPTRFDLLPVADAPPLLSEFRGIPSENFRVGEIPIHGIDVNNPEFFKNEETARSEKLTVAPETKSFGTNTEEVIMISEDAKIPGSTSSDVVVDDVPTTSVMADVGEIEVTSNLPTDQNEAKVMWSTGEVIEDRMGEVPIDWTETVDATKEGEVFKVDSFLPAHNPVDAPAGQQLDYDPTSKGYNTGEPPMASPVPESKVGFSPQKLDVRDPPIEDFYPEPVRLDATHSRQYIQLNANGRRVVAMPDTGATVNFMSMEMYQREFSHLPMRQVKMHQVKGVNDTDKEKGKDTEGLVQLRMHFCGKVINTNFLVGKSHDPRLLILGQAWQDKMLLNVGFDLRWNRVVYMNHRIVPSCIVNNGRLVVVRAMHLMNKTVDAPYLPPHRCRDYKFAVPEYADGTDLEVSAGITATGLGVVNHLTTVRQGRITVPLFNLTSTPQQVFPELLQLKLAPIEEGDVIMPTTLDGEDVFNYCSEEEVNGGKESFKTPEDARVASASGVVGTTGAASPEPPVDKKVPNGSGEKYATIDRPYNAEEGMKRIRAMIKLKQQQRCKVPHYEGVDWTVQSDLSEEESIIARYGMEEVMQMFALHKDDLGEIKGVKHRVNVQGAEPIAQPMRPVPLAKRGVITEEVARMLRCGVIQPSSSPWSSPIVLIKKKDGGWRFCVDYRRLNDLTKKDKHPLPRIDDMLDRLSQGRYFSSVDLNSGYWQIAMDEESYEETAFTVAEGHYEFVKMPFGLTNAPATFQRGMQMILAYVNYKICLCFLDDVIIFSRTFWQHLYDILCVLLALMRAGVKLSGKKCEFFKNSIDFLGHVVSAKGIATQKAKTEVISKMLTPRNEKELRSFLGLTGYYRRFCQDYAVVAAPLYAMLQKRPPEVTFQSRWGEKQDNALQILKERLTTPPILAFPDISKDFRLVTDASMDGIGNILTQMDDDGVERVISYGSRTYHDSEKNYHMPNKECLAVVYAFRSYRQYLLGARTLLITDCSCLVPLLTSKALRSVVPEGQIFRWMLALQEYDYVVIHMAGSKVPHADAVSRRPICHGPPPEEKRGQDLDDKLVFTLEAIQMIAQAFLAPLRRSPRFAEPDSAGKKVAASPSAGPKPVGDKDTTGVASPPDSVPSNTPRSPTSTRTGSNGGIEGTTGTALPRPSGEPGPAPATSDDNTSGVEEEETSDDDDHEDGDLEDLGNQTRRDQAEEAEDTRRITIPTKDGRPWKGTATKKKAAFFELLNFPMPWLAKDIQAAQAQDAAFGPLAEFKRTGIINIQWSTLIKNWIPAHHDDYFLHNGLLYHVNVRKRSNAGAVYHIQMCIPQPFRLILLEMFHCTVWGAHQPLDTMLAKMEVKYYWPSMVADTRNFVESCAPCQMYKVGPNRKIPLKPIRAISPFYMIGMDVLTPSPAAVTNQGNKHILVVQDYFTKWVVAIAIPDQTASTIMRCLLDHVFSVHGCPRIVLSDNGPCFTANQFTTSLKEMGVVHRYSAPYHQQTNGLVERWNRTLMVMLRTLLQNNADNWDEYLQMACFAYRTTPHSSTGATPFELLYGREPVFPADALFSNTQKVYSDNDHTYLRRLVVQMKEMWKLASERLDEAQERYKQQYDKRAKIRKFEPGSLVLRAAPETLSSKHIPSKFHAYFDHLFRVVEDMGTDLKLEKVLPPKLSQVVVPKQFCKLFRGTVRDYADMQEGITIPPSEWTHLSLFPKKTRHQQTDPKPPLARSDDDDDENAICPTCKVDYESSKEKPWIQCDRCYHWFHFACVGLTQEPRERWWYCDPCHKARRMPSQQT